jgi:putative transposase
MRPEDTAIRQRLRELASERRRFGYRRLHQMLKREGTVMNLKKIRRLYSEERLQVRQRKGRKRATGTRAPMTIPQGANQRWSLDFVSDVLAGSRRFRVLAVVDDYTAECLCLVAVWPSCSGHKNGLSNGTTLPQASPSRTLSSRVSMASYAMSF